MLKAAGVEPVYAEKISGARSDRAQLAKLLKALGEGDTVIVTRLDRLARSTRDLLNILHAIAKSGATFKSLADAWADTTTPHGRLMVTILGGLAEFERDLIKARTDDGRRRAMARGKRFGRKPKLSAFQIEEALRRRDADYNDNELGGLGSTGDRRGGGAEARPSHLAGICAHRAQTDRSAECKRHTQPGVEVRRDPCYAIVRERGRGSMVDFGNPDELSRWPGEHPPQRGTALPARTALPSLPLIL